MTSINSATSIPNMFVGSSPVTQAANANSASISAGNGDSAFILDVNFNATPGADSADDSISSFAFGYSGPASGAGKSSFEQMLSNIQSFFGGSTSFSTTNPTTADAAAGTDASTAGGTTTDTASGTGGADLSSFIQLAEKLVDDISGSSPQNTTVLVSAGPISNGSTTPLDQFLSALSNGGASGASSNGTQQADAQTPHHHHHHHNDAAATSSGSTDGSTSSGSGDADADSGASAITPAGSTDASAITADSSDTPALTI